MTLFWVSQALLWVVVIVLAVAVFALARQVGLLHERIAPAGALSPTRGPQVGELVEPERIIDLHGHELVIGGSEPGGRSTLILFTSPSCPVCRELVPIARRVAATERLRLVFASDGGTRESHVDYTAEMGLGGYPYLLSRALGLRFGVSHLPFAVLIDRDGRLAARGLVNTREHLESLLEAMRTGVPNLQAYLAMEQRR